MKAYSHNTTVRYKKNGQGKQCPAPFEIDMYKDFYRIFGHVFYMPDREFTKYLRTGFIEDIQLLEDDAKAEFSRFLDEYSEKDDDSFYYTLAVEYTRLFVNGMPSVPCPPYESVYRENTTMGMCTLDVLARYTEAGLKVLDNFHDLPDHIAVELEFLHYLLAKGDRETHDSFVREHLSKWVSAFSKAVEHNSRINFYRHAAAVLEQTISKLASAPC